MVTTLLPLIRIDASQAIAMICGPEIMMRYTIKELEHLGMADTDIFLSMERNMQCATGLCGHCQYGPHFICRDGPVFSFERIRDQFTTREL